MRSFMPLVKAGKGVARGWFEPGRDLMLSCLHPLCLPLGSTADRTRLGKARPVTAGQVCRVYSKGWGARRPMKLIWANGWYDLQGVPTVKGDFKRLGEGLARWLPVMALQITRIMVCKQRDRPG